MPGAVDRCVSALTKKWEADPSSRPEPKKPGQDAKAQAFAMCNARVKASIAESLEIMLEGGKGPTFIGAAATNRPYIPHLKPTEILEEDDKEFLLVHLANSGHFKHPTGAFTLNRAVFSTFIANHAAKLIGQDAAYDCRHRPDDGAYGWFQRLYLGDEIGKGEKEFWGRVEPTPVGLERIKAGEYRYSSMEFHRNFERDDVVLDLERSEEMDVCLDDLEPETPVSETETEEDMPKDDDKKVELELEKAQNEIARLKGDKGDSDAKILEQQKKLEEAEKQLLLLQKATVDAEATVVVELAKNHRDKDGNALPRQLFAWAEKFLKLEDIGEGDGIVQLEKDVEVPNGVRRFMIAAVKNLVLSMPGTVPADRNSHSGSEDQGNKEEEFDFDELWDESEKEE